MKPAGLSAAVGSPERAPAQHDAPRWEAGRLGIPPRQRAAAAGGNGAHRCLPYARAELPAMRHIAKGLRRSAG